MFLWLNKRLNASIESFRLAVSQHDSSGKCSIMVTFAEVTDWHLVTRAGGGGGGEMVGRFLHLHDLRFVFPFYFWQMSYLVRKGKDFLKKKIYRKESKLPACVNAKKKKKKILSIRDNLHKSSSPNSRYSRDIWRVQRATIVMKKFIFKLY